MSGFAAGWLALREPHDTRARDTGLVRALAHWLGEPREITVVDMGSGTGSNLRWLAQHLPGRQHWRLVEHDPELIAAGMGLLPRGGDVSWRYVEADLESRLEAIVGEGCDLLACSALLDLVSAGWLARLARLASTQGIPLHAALTYDGRIGLQPPHRNDARVTDLVNAHQRTDKGFGPALGPDAAATLERLLEVRPGRTLCAPSDWRLEPEDREIQEALLEGWAGAAAEMAPEEAALVASWRAERLAALRADSGRCLVGHRDLLWLPG
ncbi:class I SAM-dependent methyltransferase [Marinimicrococcus flavescens]|uniref:Class I SAM-dependent methyltransferase n=1 Tax=Marinimicrococcus flavescens TaxID=3031815 RepID=A0AAP3XSZ9_9PROT|nr:class I SAM-dependent methyltransferase [Marinimicrococcus flavescens]